jgi:hypothetical protein
LPTVMLRSHTCQLRYARLCLSTRYLTSHNSAKRCSSVLLVRLSLPTCAPLALSPNGLNPLQTGMPTCPATAE